MYGVEILLTRSLTPFLLSLYLPSSLLVAISWLSCALLPHPLLRLSLQVVVTMALLHLISATRAATPPANTVTAIEVWLLTCLLLSGNSISNIVTVLILHHSSFGCAGDGTSDPVDPSAPPPLHPRHPVSSA